MRRLLLFSVICACCYSASGFAGDLSKSIPYPYYASQDGSQNQVRLIDDGIDAFNIRLEMIARAKYSIAVEYFIYNTDVASRIFSKALVAAAARGVKVRLLIDKSAPIFVFDKYYAKELKARGIEVRYYNAAAIWRISTVQFRDHRKLLAIDDAEAVTGGRNIADEYFDLSKEFNFNDADIFVRGPIVKVMRESFDRFFNNHISEVPAVPKPSKVDPLHHYRERTARAKQFFETVPEEASVVKRILAERASGDHTHRLYTCPTMTFSTDAPGANFFKRLQPDFVDRFRFLRKTLFDKTSAVDRRLIVTSPYIIDFAAADDLLKRVQANGAKVEFYTNSLASTDAVYVAANMYLGLRRWLSKGVKVSLHDGKWISRNDETPPEIRSAKAGLHSKIHVYETSDYSEVMIGTYNVDHRSNYYNTEMALFCKGNDDFTSEVVASLKADEASGLAVATDGRSAINRDGKAISVYGLTGDEVKKMKRKTMLYWLARELL